MASTDSPCDHMHTLADPRCVKCGKTVGRLRAVGDGLGFVDRMETRPTDMRRSIHQSHRGEGRNFVD